MYPRAMILVLLTIAVATFMEPDVALRSPSRLGWRFFTASASFPAYKNTGAGAAAGDCERDADCDDGNVCTDDSCDPERGCQNTPNDDPCNDGQLCTMNDACSEGECSGDPIDVDDGNPCTVCICDEGTGRWVCDLGRGNECAYKGDCAAGFECVDCACTPVGPPACEAGADCNDGNVCTDDSCDPERGCQNPPNDDPCDDGNACTVDDVCSEGECSGDPLEVDDGNPCTVCICDPAAGWVCNLGRGNECANNGNCAADFECVDCACAPVGPPACEAGADCNDEIACTEDDCVDGECVNAPTASCDDGVGCTEDSCNPESPPGTSGCENVANDANCNDEDACTHDMCDPDDPGAGEDGCVNVPIDSSDGVDCTDDFCVPAEGDVSLPNDANCDDGLFCNGAETCDPVNDCQAGTNPCSDPDFPVCHEDTDTCEAAFVSLDLDIRPGKCPNDLKRGSNGAIWVGLLGSADFDIAQVDPSMVRLSRADGEGQAIEPHGNPRFKDVATPIEGEPCDCHAAGTDGILDLRAKFKTAAMEEAFGLGAEPSGTFVELMLTGTLLDGTPFEAHDCIRIMR